jgi:hypothetical protein
MEGFHTRTRPVVGLHYPESDVTMNVWWSGDDGFIFGLNHKGLTIDVQTRRAGIEAIRDACNDALVRTDD